MKKLSLITFIVVFGLVYLSGPAYRGAKKASDKVLGPHHPVSEALGQPPYKWAVAAVDHTLGESRPDVAESLKNLIELYFDPEKREEYQRRFQEAEEWGRNDPRRPLRPVARSSY